MGTKNRKNVSFFLTAVLMAASFLFISSTAAPAETVKYRLSAYLTDIGMVAVGDAKGHMVGHYMRRGLASSKMGKWPPTATGGRLILPRASAPAWDIPYSLNDKGIGQGRCGIEQEQ